MALVDFRHEESTFIKRKEQYAKMLAELRPKAEAAVPWSMGRLGVLPSLRSLRLRGCPGWEYINGEWINGLQVISPTYT